jgi:hypothetical protein
MSDYVSSALVGGKLYRLTRCPQTVMRRKSYIYWAQAQPEGTGIARIVAALAVGLDPTKYHVHAWFLGAPGPLIEYLREAGAAAHSIKWWRGTFRRSQIRCACSSSMRAADRPWAPRADGVSKPIFPPGVWLRRSPKFTILSPVVQKRSEKVRIDRGFKIFESLCHSR